MSPRPSTAPPFNIVVGTIAFFAAFLLLGAVLWDDIVAAGSRRAVVVLGAIGVWRYGWAGIHLVRSLIYRRVRFPVLRRDADQVAERELVPHVFFLVTSYRIDAEVSARVYRSVIEEAARYGAPATIVAAVTDAADEGLLADLFARLEPPEGISLVLMRQAGTGKRDAMAGILKAIARRTPPPGSLVVFMDGDTELVPDTLRRSLPFFRVLPGLGALSTDSRAAVEGSNWAKEWFDMRFAQRHLLMCSLSLSRRLLVLTGRFSVFRAELATDPSFIDILENDVIDHWRHGRMKFLTGDDKSTWFWLLKHRWDMLYVPDVQVVTWEDLSDGGFVPASLGLMKRWFGNMLRNNGRAIALGPRAMPFFLWWTLIDQRLSMWTTLTGPTFAALMTVFVSPGFIALYALWVMFTRFAQTLLLVSSRGRFSPYFPPLLYYTQIVGSLVKIYVLFRLDRQSWSRQGIRTLRRGGAGLWLRDASTVYINMVAFGAFLLAMAYLSGVLPPPDALSLARFRTEATVPPPPLGTAAALVPGVKP